MPRVFVKAWRVVFDGNLVRVRPYGHRVTQGVG